jgi:hypothetical protein
VANNLQRAATTDELADERLKEILESRRGARTRKTVRWPDQVGDEEEEVFRVGRPRQLEVVHLIPGLGPNGVIDNGEWHSPSAVSFADAVRAEHSSEQRLMKRIHEGEHH